MRKRKSNFFFFLKYDILNKRKEVIMKIGIANDHAGVTQKKELVKYLNLLGYEVINFGTDSEDSVDYPDYAKKLCSAYLKKEIDYGIAICYTGIGMSIACNKIRGIRAAKVDNVEEAYLTRSHNDANIIVLSARKNIEDLKSFVKIFLETSFSNEERHIRRIGKLEP